MAIPKIKTTYSLDVETVRGLDALARRWDVSRSEALRRTVRIVLGHESVGNATALDALDEAQETARMSRAAAARWQRDVRTERRARGGKAKRA